MTGEGEGRKRETERADFGPPTGDFGPPVSEFGPPTGDLPVPGWKPQGAEHPELAWRPADSPAPVDPPSVPAPPQQYRAPDSSTPVFRPPPGDADATTVRHQLSSEQASRDRSSSDRVPDSEQATIRHRSAGEPSWSSPSDLSGGADPLGESARPRAGGLSWDSDPIAQKLTPTSVSEAVARKPRRDLPVGMIVTAAAVIVAVIAVVVAIVVVRGGGDEAAPASGGGSPLCASSQDGGVTVGNGAGATTGGAQAVLGFQYAFYVERSGAGARKFVAADSPTISSAETIQQAIDGQIPVGTQHCVRVTERSASTFDVDLTERRPDGTTTVYKQTVTTVERDGKTVLWEIADRR